MTTTISDGTNTTVPDLVLGYESTRETGTIVHAIIGSASPDVTLRPAMLRTGRLALFYTTKDAAFAAEAMHNAASSFTIADTDVPDIGMTYVLAGQLGQALEDTTRARWILTVPFQEISP